jgi:outer membrane autotransporter protein
MHGFVMGGDRSIAVRAGRWHIGAAFSHIEAERTFEDSPSHSSSIQLGLYSILRADNGVYASATASVGDFNHALAAHAPDGGKTTGKFSNYGAGVSIESGRRFESSGLWFVEPHIGMDYFKVNGADYKMSNGLAIRDHGGHLFQWRNGLRIGRTARLSNDKMAMAYAKISWVKEFGDKSVVHANQTALHTELSDSRFEFGIGTEAKLGKNHALYCEVNYGEGHRIKQLKTITAGYQYRW